MKKTLCFILENKNLYLDKVLVSFNDTPIFYTCLDQDSNYYLVLCTDLDNFNYIVISIKLNELYNMLINKIDMRTPFINADYFWEIKTGENPETDEVRLLERNSLDISFLPIEGAMYNKISTEDRKYVEKIELKYLSNCQFEETIPLELDTKKIELSDNTPSLLDFGSNCWNLYKEVEIPGNVLDQSNNSDIDYDDRTKYHIHNERRADLNIYNKEKTENYFPNLLNVA